MASTAMLERMKNELDVDGRYGYSVLRTTRVMLQ